MKKGSIHSWWKLVFVVGLYVLSVPALAGVRVSILWGPFPGRTDWRNYASGTRCEFVVHAYTDTAYAFMSRVRIKIGGETVKDFTLTGVFMPYIYVVTRFASTHFADNTNIELYAEAWDSTGATASTSRSILVYNKATLYGRSEWENDAYAPSAGVPQALQWLEFMNHDVSHTCVAPGWTKQMLLGDLYPCMVFYVNTHGYGVEGEHTALAWIGSDVGEFIYPAEVDAVRLDAVGSGVPAFNTGTPPIGLAFVDACLTGLNSAFAYALLTPFDNAYTHNWCENQAQVGWRIRTLVSRTRVCNEAFWTTLAQGKTAH